MDWGVFFCYCFLIIQLEKHFYTSHMSMTEELTFSKANFADSSRGRMVGLSYLDDIPTPKTLKED